MKAETLGDFIGSRGSHKVLLIGEKQDGHTHELLFEKKLLQLMTSFFEALLVGRVDDVDENVGVIKVVPPVRSNLSLTADVPHIEFEAVGRDRLDVEALSGRDMIRFLGG